APADPAPHAASAELSALRAAAPAPAEPAPDAAAAALSALRAVAPAPAEPAPDAAAAALSALRTAAPAPAEPASPDLEDILAPMRSVDPMDDLDALLAPAPAAAPVDDLDALLTAAPMDDLDALLTPAPAAAPVDDLDALLAPPHVADPLAELEALLASPVVPVSDPLDDLDALLARPEPPPELQEGTTMPGLDAPIAPSASPFGVLSAPAPRPDGLHRTVFRMAVFGDFSGRAAGGAVEVGEKLATRRAQKLDVDTVEDVIARFATRLVLPIGPEGRGIAVKLGGIDDLHPDELAETVELFDELKGLRQRLTTASTAARAVAEMQGWGASFTTHAAPTHSRSAASAVPADRRLTDFQRLIGDGAERLATPSPAADLIARIVGPYVLPGTPPEAKVLRATLDEAMGAAMRLVLHHPEFQAIEAAWRTLDLLARQVETDEKLEITIFDISAEEFAADLGGAANLAASGIFKILNEPLTVEGGTGYSAVVGLYTFEETPPHAQILGRMGRIAAHVRAPFLAAMGPGCADVAKRDRHPMVARAWDALRAEPMAAWLGLAAPRFLLRRPYGAKSDPIDAFDFEEFTMSEGLSGMLWCNPAVLAAILLAKAWTDDGPKMTLGKAMSLGQMPYHVVTDRHGDQTALPCTERNVSTDVAERIVQRGFMPVLSVRGRDVVRLGSFQSLAGTDIAGPWSSSPPSDDPEGGDRVADVAATFGGGAVDDDLDALLAGFGDSAAPSDPSAIDADLAALLEGL
ncbi:MAG: type VI secretion system contractile sheath domain-containing protein, partial [Gemmobacter sp.]